MPNPSIVRFDYDPTGVNPDNLVSNEIHALTDNYVRAFAPTYGPFFADSVVLFDNANDRQLVRGVDYSITELNQDITLRLGKEVSSVMLVLHPSVSNVVRMTYQVVGGLYQNQADAIANMYNTLLQDGRPIEWANILGKPLQFPPTLHLHNLEDVYGFEPLVNAIERIRSAIILSDVPAFEALIDWIKRCCVGEVDARVAGDNNLLELLQDEIIARITADNEIRTLISSTGGGGGGGAIPYANTPVITSPANNSVIEPTTQVFTCTMDSADITVGAYFEWQIATTNAFTTILSQTTTGTGTFAPPNLPYNSNYYVRVRYVHPSPAITTAWSVAIKCSPPAYANTPVITTPQNNSVDIPLTQVFTCSMVSQGLTVGAYFEWQIATTNAFTTILHQTTTGTTAYTPPDLTNGIDLWIRVRYVHPSPAITTAWSAAIKCTTVSLISPLSEIGLVPASDEVKIALRNKVLMYVHFLPDIRALYFISKDYNFSPVQTDTEVILYSSDVPVGTSIVNTRLETLHYSSGTHFAAVAYMEYNGFSYSGPKITFISSTSGGQSAISDWRHTQPPLDATIAGPVYNAQTVMGFSNFTDGEQYGYPDNIDFFISKLGTCVYITHYNGTYHSYDAGSLVNGTTSRDTIQYPQLSQIPTGSEFGKNVYLKIDTDQTLNKLIISAPRDSVVTNNVVGPQHGAVYVYKYITGTGYVVDQVINSPSALPNRTRFGNDIGCNGTFLAITEHFTNAPPVLYIYNRVSSQWALFQTIPFTSFMERYDNADGPSGSNNTEPFNTSNWNADVEISFPDNAYAMMINFKDFYRKVFIFEPALLSGGEGWEFVKTASYKYNPERPSATDTPPYVPVDATFCFDNNNRLDMVAIVSESGDDIHYDSRIVVYD